MNRRSVFTAALLTIAFSVNAASAETLEGARKKIAEATAKHKSAKYKTKMTGSTGVTEGTTEWVRDGKQFKMRTEMKMTIKIGETKTVNKTLSISDGKFMYMFNDSMGMKSAMKMKVDEKTLSTLDSEIMFKENDKTYAMKLLPDETINGKPAYVIEMTPKDEATKAHIGKNITYYDKKTGMHMKSVSYNPKGKVDTTIVVSEVKLNEKISADRFVFKAPEGVQVVDMTKMPGG